MRCTRLRMHKPVTRALYVCWSVELKLQKMNKVIATSFGCTLSRYSLCSVSALMCLAESKAGTSYKIPRSQEVHVLLSLQSPAMIQ